VDAITSELEEDKGYIGEDLEGLTEFPSIYPTTYRGFYRTLPPILVQVYASNGEQEFRVLATAQAEFLRSELMSIMEARISAKDIRQNDALLLSCGAPDQGGHRCPADEFLFREIVGMAEQLDFRPVHLKAIYIHLWGTTAWMELFRDGSCHLNWPKPS
jgi:hypothetical protein